MLSGYRMYGVNKLATICMIYAQDHRKHVIIRRQVSILMQHSQTVMVIDSPEIIDEKLTDYKRIQIKPFVFLLLSKWCWKFIRPIAIHLPAFFSESYWFIVYFFRLLVMTMARTYRAVKIHADYYQAHDLESLLAAYISGILCNSKVIFDAHEMASKQGYPTETVNKLWRRLEDWMIPNVDVVILSNKFRAMHYSMLYKLQQPPVIIHNYAPEYVLDKNDLVRQTLNIDTSKKVVLYHGSLMAGRCLEQLLEASVHWRSDAALVLIGMKNDFYYDVLQPIWTRLELERKVYFLDYIDTDLLGKYIQSADIGIVIYKNTNLNNYYCAPSKLYEYIQADIPIAGCDFPEVTSVLDDVFIGFKFNSEDPLSIANAVDMVIDQINQNKTLFRDNLKRARYLFDYKSELYKYISLFQ